MTAAAAHPAGPHGGAAAARQPFLWLALGMAAVALGGFARSYYLKGLFATPALPPVLHAHALLMSGWLSVFIIQSWLIAARRVAWHRRLGVAAAVLAALVVLSGAALTVLAFEREARAHAAGKFHYLLLINLVNLLLFAGLIGAGLALRARAGVHKRLMLLAAVTILAPAAARVALLAGHAPLLQFLAFYGCILGCVLVDGLWHRRLHPVLGWGALVVIAAFQLSYYAVQRPAWLSFLRHEFW
jgi:hypothetical protein